VTLRKGPPESLGNAGRRYEGTKGKLKNQRSFENTPSPNKNQHSLLAVYDGQRCRGFILERGRTGWEAFDSSERTLGLYQSQAAAADAIESEVAS
jgi:hypothetical protein